MLHRVGRRIAGRLSQLPPVLAFDGAQQPLQIDLHAPAGFRAGKARSDAGRDQWYLTCCLT
jgi:hypothetical protein